MLALEQKATALKDGSINVSAQPFGGGVRILNSNSLREMLGEIEFDSEHSKQKQDFRILITPSKWALVKSYCLDHLASPDDHEIESTPDRELIEEFEETLHVDIKPGQYTVEPLGIVIEDNPVLTENWYARGYPTVRVYRTYQVQIIDLDLCELMLAANDKYSDQELVALAAKDLKNGGSGRINSVVALPLNRVTEAYRALPLELRYKNIVIEDRNLDESVLAILGNIDVPQYQRL